MKTIFIGDIHGRSIWKDIVKKENPDRVIFMGDYFDSFNISSAEQVYNFNSIIRYKLESEIEVQLLIGNHDFHYMLGVDERYSGFQHKNYFFLNEVVMGQLENMKMAYSFGNILCTHAGVSSVFMDEIFGNDWVVDDVAEILNDLFKYKPLSFKFNGSDLYGNDVTQSPIWIRPPALLKSNKKRDIKKRWIQIVGHTEIGEFVLSKQDKTMKGNYYLIDTLEIKKYLIFDDGFKMGEI